MAYQDSRQISSTGLLTKPAAQTSTVKPIVLKSKGVNYNKTEAVTDPDKEWSRNMAEKQFKQSQHQFEVQQANSGGGKIICIRWHELGFMDDEMARLDQMYGQWLLAHDKAWMRGYLTYAPHIVKRMNPDTWQGRLFLKAIGPLVNPWAREMAFRMGGNYKHSVFGALLMELSTFVFRALDKIRLLKIKSKSPTYRSFHL